MIARIPRGRRSTSLIALMAAITISVVTLSCGKSGPDVNPEKYREWTKTSTEHFNFHISPKSNWVRDSVEITKGYERFLAEICVILEMQIPTEKIDLYIYASGLELREMTGGKDPFSTEEAIHWGGLYPYGYQLTKFLLKKRGKEPGQFKAVNEGLAHLLDFSGFNYHDKTNRLVNSGKFRPLAELGDNTLFDSLDFRARRAESASLCGFIMYNFGLERLFMLMESSVDWKRSLETIFQLPLDEFEKAWLEFARAESKDPLGTMDDDPANDMRMRLE